MEATVAAVPTGEVGAGGRRPLVSVLVATHLGVERLPQCVASLAAQTMDRAAFEVVVVVNGPDDGSAALLAAARSEHPGLRLRVLRVTEPGVARARDLGLAACRGDHVTFLDDDDTLSPGFLQAASAVAEPGVVVVAPVGDLRVGEQEPDLDNYIARALAPHAGRRLTAEELPTALCYNAAKLVGTAIARSVPWDPALRSGEDQVWWLSLLARHRFALRVLGPGEALYLRVLRPGSIGRRPLSHDFHVTQRLECLQALERVDRADPGVRRVGAHLMRSQAGFVNDYLRAHPEQHHAVVAEAAVLGLGEVPWERVNQGLARDLAVCYNFAPFVDTSAMVAAKRMSERGLVTDVVSQDLTGLRARDPRTSQVAAEVVAATRVVATPPSLLEWWGVAPFVEEAWRFVVEQEERQGPYRSVYSRAMAVGSPFAAALIKLRRPDIEWVAELSDPLFVDLLGGRRLHELPADPVSTEIATGVRAAGYDLELPGQLFEAAERVTYALADRIVFTNPLQRQVMLSHCTDPRLVERVRARSVVSPHPQLPERFYHRGDPSLERTPGAVHLAYFGTFYGTRDLGVLIEAVGRLRQSERDRLRVHVYTDRRDRLALRLLRAGLAGVVVAHDYVPALDFLNLATRFDVLVVDDAVTVGHHAVNPYLPSKLADYAGSGTPVWGIYEPGSTMSTLPLDHSTPLGDVDAAVAVLRELVAGDVSR